MYRKEKIEALFKAYVSSKSAAVLDELLVQCDPVIDVILQKYSQYEIHLDDLKQEIKLRLWKTLNENVERLKKEFVSPTTYLFFRIRVYARFALARIRAEFGEQVEINFSDYGEKVFSLVQSEFLDPEYLYIARREIPQQMFERCRNKLMSNKALAKDLHALEVAIIEVRRAIEDSFCVRLADEESR